MIIIIKTFLNGHCYNGICNILSPVNNVSLIIIYLSTHQYIDIQ